MNDEICLAHGLSVLDECDPQRKKKRMKPGEYQAGLHGDSWKLDLIQAINEALEYATSRESFIENMEVEGYEVSWVPNRKHITFTCPNGRKCRDSSLHDETFLKENLEAILLYRQATGFRPTTPEPDEGWMGELAAGWVRVAAELERDEQWQLLAPPTWTDSKQRRREALKKMAMGQKFGGNEELKEPLIKFPALYRGCDKIGKKRGAGNEAGKFQRYGIQVPEEENKTGRIFRDHG